MMIGEMRRQRFSWLVCPSSLFIRCSLCCLHSALRSLFALHRLHCILPSPIFRIASSSRHCPPRGSSHHAVRLHAQLQRRREPAEQHEAAVLRGLRHPHSGSVDHGLHGVTAASCGHHRHLTKPLRTARHADRGADPRRHGELQGTAGGTQLPAPRTIRLPLEDGNHFEFVARAMFARGVRLAADIKDAEVELRGRRRRQIQRRKGVRWQSEQLKGGKRSVPPRAEVGGVALPTVCSGPHRHRADVGVGAEEGDYDVSRVGILIRGLMG